MEGSGRHVSQAHKEQKTWVETDLLQQGSDLLRSLGREERLPKGDKIRSNSVYLLLEGRMTLSSTEPSGEEVTLIYFEPGMLANFIPSLSSTLPLHDLTQSRLVIRKNFVIKTRSECRCIVIEPDRFRQELKTNLLLNKLLLLALTENLLNMFSLATNSSTLPAIQRVCRLLMQFVKKTAPHLVDPPLTYQDIATHLSMHAMTVAKIFTALKNEGLIARKGRQVIVTDMGKMRDIAMGLRELDY